MCPTWPQWHIGAMSDSPGLIRRSDRACLCCGVTFDPRPTGRGKPRSYCEGCRPHRTRTHTTGRPHPLLIPLTAAARRYLASFEISLAHPESREAFIHRTRMFLALRARGRREK